MANHRPLNILMVSPRCYPEGGGAEYNCYQVAKRLVASWGHQVTVLCGSTQKKSSVERRGGLAIIWLKPDFFIASAPVSINLLWRIVKLVQEKCNGPRDRYHPLPPSQRFWGIQWVEVAATGPSFLRREM